MAQDLRRDRIVTRSMTAAKIQDGSSDVERDTPAADGGHRQITGTSPVTSPNLLATPLTTIGRGMASLGHQTPGQILVDRLRQQMRRDGTVTVSSSGTDGMNNSTPTAPNVAELVMKPGKAHTSVMTGIQPANRTTMASASLVVPSSSSAAIGSTPVLSSTLMTSSGSPGGSVLPTGGKGKARGASQTQVSKSPSSRASSHASVTSEAVAAMQAQLTTLQMQMATNAELMNAMMSTLMQQRGAPVVPPLTGNVLVAFNQQNGRHGVDGSDANSHISSVSEQRVKDWISQQSHAGSTTKQPRASAPTGPSSGGQIASGDVMDLGGVGLTGNIAGGAGASVVAAGVPEGGSAQQTDGQQARDMMAQLLELLKAWPGAQSTSCSSPQDSGKATKTTELGVKSALKDVSAAAAKVSTNQLIQSPVIVASPMPSYTGDTPVGPYLEQFKCKAKVNRWPKEEWGLQLLSALDGRARNLLAIEQFGENPDYDVVAAKLKENFSSDMSSLAHRHELDLLVRGVSERGTPEPLVNLMVRVKSMAMKAFPTVDAETRQQLAIPYFIRALNNKLLEQSIWAATPTTLSRALEVALACENGLRSSTDTSQATGRPAPKVRQVTDESYEQNEFAGMLDAVRVVTAGLEKRLDKHEQTINRKLNDFTKNQLATATQGKDANMEALDRGVKCYGCGKLGHVKRDCREKKDDRRGAVENWKWKQQCYACGEAGHLAKECPTRQSGNRNGKQDFEEGRGAGQLAPGLQRRE